MKKTSVLILILVFVNFNLSAQFTNSQKDTIRIFIRTQIANQFTWFSDTTLLNQLIESEIQLVEGRWINHLNSGDTCHSNDFVYHKNHALIELVNRNKQVFLPPALSAPPIQPPPSSTVDICDDGGFESKDMGNWGWQMKGYYRPYLSTNGDLLSFSGNTPTINTALNSATLTYNFGGHPIVLGWDIVSTGTDPLSGVPQTLFNNKAFKMGLIPTNPSTPPFNGVETISKTITVTPENSWLSFWYSLVFDVGHTNSNESGFFGLKVNGDYIPILPNQGISTSPIFQYNTTPFLKFKLVGGTLPIYYTEWNCASIDLSDYEGQDVTIEFVNADCSQTGHWSYVYLDGICEGCENSINGYINLAGNCDTITGSYSLPYTIVSSTTTYGTLNSIKLYPYKNGKKINGSTAYTIPVSIINTTTKTFKLSRNFIKSLWPSLGEYDVVAVANFTNDNTSYDIYSKLRGYFSGFNNDVLFSTNLKIDSQMIYKNECLVKVKTTYSAFEPTSSSTCKLNTCDFNEFINNFNFNKGFYNYSSSYNGYTLISYDSFYNCNTDEKWYQLRYRCISHCDTFFFTIKISTDCNIWLCDQLTCGSNAGTTLNPFLNNLKGGLRMDKTLVYNAKRTSLVSNNVRSGEYYSVFSPLYSTNSWVLSSDNNWIVNNHITLYNHKGNPLETRNPLNIYSATRYGFNHSLPTAVISNSKFRNFISLGFDDEEYYDRSCTNITTLHLEKYFLPIFSNDINAPKGRMLADQSLNIESAVSSNSESHTGNYSYLVTPSCIESESSPTYFGCDKMFLSKVIPLCGPSDPDYAAATYNIHSGIDAQTVNNSYNANFNLEKGKKYVLSYWAKNAPQPTLAPTLSPAVGYLKIYLDCDTNYIREFVPNTELVEGWKQMTQVFEVENTTTLVKMVFMPHPYGTYYDDIRIFPFDANMKSFVYYPRSLKLSAELDENNYATFYEYDEEGNLVRIKKETERGIMTIKEQRNILKTQ